MPYGFPSGAQLRHKLCSSAPGGALKKHFGIDELKVFSFSRAFLMSRQPSIDTFLAKRDDLVEIGKLCIAVTLCSLEQASSLFKPDCDDDWYLPLWSAMQDDAHAPASIATNPVRFVTFNYDRSLECFLLEAIKNSFRATDEESARVCSRISIQHVYGQLGAFRWHDGSTGRVYAYGNTADDIEAAAKDIRVIPETREDDSTFQAVRASVEWAEQICILGFGFDPLNMQRLALHSVFEWLTERGKKPPPVFASTYGMTPAEVARVGQAYFSRTNFIPFPHKNLMTLRESGVLA